MGGALTNLRDRVSDDFLAMNGDILTDTALSDRDAVDLLGQGQDFGLAAFRTPFVTRLGRARRGLAPPVLSEGSAFPPAYYEVGNAMRKRTATSRVGLLERPAAGSSSKEAPESTQRSWF